MRFIKRFLQYRFRTGVKDLEVMMQNVINSAFETITTVEGGIEVLDVMMRLASREVCPFKLQTARMQYNAVT